LITSTREHLRGQIVVTFALASVALFAIVALAVDGARVLVEQRGLQNGVDGAALTGALDLGPGAAAPQSAWAIDDTVYAIERTLGIDFSNNYTAPSSYNVAHRLVGGATSCVPSSCTSSPVSTIPPGPFNPSNAGSSPCCNGWVDRSGAYTLTITTPYNYKNSGENEAFIYVQLTHEFPLVFSSSLYPTIGVSVTSIARNHAIPYAIFAFKHNDSSDIYLNGNTSLQTNKRVGDNGSLSSTRTQSVTFVCSAQYGGQYGGDLWEYTPTSSTSLNIASISEGHCPGPYASLDTPLGGYEYPPNVNLPPDPTSTALQSGSVASGVTAMLIPTRSLDPTQPLGPRYSNIQVNGTLILQPGVYFFEGTTSPAGLNISAGGTVETGDCYLQTLPNCTATTACGVPMTPVVPWAGIANSFHCTSDRDFGVLLVFWPAGSDVNATSCSNQNPALSGNYYCTLSSGSSGAVNTMALAGGANIYLTSTPKFHDVSLFVDPNHAGDGWNFTTQSSMSGSGCTTQVCAKEFGLGSNVISIQGGGSISINGAMLAPNDNVSLGGTPSGDGYGQVLAYTITIKGTTGVAENYNPLALAYVPVLVQ
jgi:putative Flp pilus-assembly TadE/G-like protein